MSFQANVMSLSPSQPVGMIPQRLIHGLTSAQFVRFLISDAFTLATAYFERLGRFQNTKISMKADYITEVLHQLLFQNTTLIFSWRKKVTHLVIRFSDSNCTQTWTLVLANRKHYQRSTQTSGIYILVVYHKLYLRFSLSRCFLLNPSAQEHSTFVFKNFECCGINIRDEMSQFSTFLSFFLSFFLPWVKHF